MNTSAKIAEISGEDKTTSDAGYFRSYSVNDRSVTSLKWLVYYWYKPEDQLKYQESKT